MILVDSNIWAYYFDASLQEHSRIIRPLETALKKSQAAVNATIVVETLHYLVKRLGSFEGERKGRVFLSYGVPFYGLDEEIVDLTLTKLKEFTHLGTGGRNVTILATMSIEGMNNLMTHDQAFKRIPEIVVIDPIKHMLVYPRMGQVHEIRVAFELETLSSPTQLLTTQTFSSYAFHARETNATPVLMLSETSE